MSEDVLDPTVEDLLPTEDEREVLLARAKEIGLSHSPNIGTDKLRERVNEKLLGTPNEAEPVEESPTANVNPFYALRQKATALKRVRITNLNPNKKHAEGEWFRAGNSVVPTITRFVAFEIDEHVEVMLLNTIKKRKYVSVAQPGKREKALAAQMASPPKRLRNEFSIEYLEPLTEAELKALAAQQSRRQAVDLKV